MSSFAFPEAPAAHAPTPFDALDALVARVAAQKDAWLQVSVVERIGLLRRCLERLAGVAEEWAQDGSRLKGIAAGDPLEGEEWLAGPMTTARNLRLLILALEAGGQPSPSALSQRPDGQKVARVFPADAKEKAMFAGVTAEVWIEKGKPASQGRIYREPQRGPGKVALVLGAGNVSSIPPMDFLYKLFVDNEVVVLKMNPVNEHLGPKLERAFAPLIDAGYLGICYGGAPVGARLTEHPQIDTLHVTGSDRTYDAIVWGADPAEQKRRKASGERKNTRPFTAELGCVTPVLAVPGPWTEGDLSFQARHVAGMVAQNASFNCNAAKVLVTARGWSERSRFLERVQEALAHTPARKAYYPGAQARYQGFIEHYPKAKAVGPGGAEVVPWTVIPDVPPEAGEYALCNEAFCGILAETALDCVDPAAYLRQAVAFANERCWGTLAMCLLIHPTTARDYARELDQAIADLRYGGVGVNVWPGLIYGMVSPTWGAFPGHPPEDIQSGAGVVHNSFLFDYPEKSVVRAPFRQFPPPVYVPGHKTLAELGRKLFELELAPSWSGVAKVAFAALRG
jgi:acyl-CoA reductase-like NAD-dependent aldehyde dehydrogenase